MDNEDGNNRSGDAHDVSAGARLIPRITIQAFCEQPQTAELIETATLDRRMSKVAVTTHNGGINGAIETFKSNPTPNLIIIETSATGQDLLNALERLSDVCDATTRVVVLGHVNDVVLYRELIRFGVSEYLVLPTSPATLVSAVSELFVAEGAAPIGRTVAFISAKGGAGSSTVAHNVAWAIADRVRQDVLLLDMDMAFGTVGLNFNQDPPHGLADAVFANEKMDAVLLDRLMSKAANHINLLTAPVTLDKAYDFSEREFEPIIEISQQSVPIVLLDVPHTWTAWVRHTLAAVDEIVIVAEPDLANLRNAKTLADAIKALRPAESEPNLVLNRIGMAKRPEIASEEFATSIGCRLIAQIPCDPAVFGTAANNGQMIAEVAGNHKANEAYRQICLEVTGRADYGTAGGSGKLKLPILSSLLKRA